MMNSIDLAMLVVTAINVFGFTLLGSYLTEKSRITSHFDKMFSLYRELRLLKQKPCHPSRIEIRSSEISELQLQIKHLYLEIGNKNIKIAPRLTQPQCRMMADCCEEFLYFNEAKKYWKKCFSYGFQLLEVESEYHRRYAQFLYHLCDFAEGNKEFQKALDLDSNTDGRKYINMYTYLLWGIELIRTRDAILKENKDEDLSALQPLIREKFELAEKMCKTIVNAKIKQDGMDQIVFYKEKHMPYHSNADSANQQSCI